MMKNKLKIALLLTIALIAAACNYKIIAEFKITNDTRAVIDSLCIEPNADTQNKYIRLKPGESYLYRANVKDAPQADGVYTLRYQSNDKKYRNAFGNYINNIPLENRINIHIGAKSIRFSED